MKANQNFWDYINGKAKLDHAIHTDPNDKAINMINKNMNHRFWQTDYKTFKKNLNSKEEFKEINEGAIFDGLKELYGHSNDVYLDNIPVELYDPKNYDVDVNFNVQIKYKAKFEYNSEYVERILFSLLEAKLFVDTETYNENTDEYDKDHFDFTLGESFSERTRIDAEYFPMEIGEVEINCYHTMDSSKWKVSRVTFGKNEKD